MNLIPRKRLFRAGLFETLETRALLASDMQLLRMDVDTDGYISPLDVLQVVNRLNETVGVSARTNSSSEVRTDVDGDRDTTPLDALMMINFINSGEEYSVPLFNVGVSSANTVGASVGRIGSSPVDPPEKTDLTFTVDSNGDLDRSCSFREDLGDGSIDFQIEIPRSLGDIAKLKAAGLIPANIRLQMPAYDVDFAGNSSGGPPERDVVLFNGVEVEGRFLTGTDDVWKLNEFDIPIELVKFPAPGEAPAINLIKINVDTASPPGDDNWCTAIDWASIEIDMAPQPVLFVHGILSNSAGWASPWVSGIQALGIPTETIDLGSDQGLLVLDSIQQNASDIAAKVSEIQQKYGVEKVNIVSHSKGGLDSRHFAEGNDSINKLIQIGTPNGGSPLADIVQAGVAGLSVLAGNPQLWAFANNLLGPAGLQLTTPHMAIYNWIHGLNPATEYVALAGDYSTGSVIGDFFLRGLMGGASDAVVPVSSVYAVAGIQALSPLASSGADKSAMHTGQVGASSVFSRLRDIASDPVTAAEAASGEMVESLRMVNTYSGFAPRGQTESRQVVVDGGDAFQIGILGLDPSLRFDLVSPNGTVVNDAFMRTSSEAVRVTVLNELGLFMQTIQVSGALAARGKWSVRVSLPASATEESAFYSVTVLTNSTLELQASTRSVVHSIGDDIVVEANLIGTSPLPSSPSMQLTILDPNGTASQVTMRDDGKAPDAVAGDGKFTAVVSGSLSGTYRMSVLATDVAQSFERSELVVALVTASDLASIGSPSFEVSDDNSNSLYDTLKVTLNVQSSVAGEHQFRAILESASGLPISESSLTIPLVAGDNEVVIPFSGREIYDRGVDGPFRLRFVRVADLQSFPALEVLSAEQSDPFRATEFEHDDIAIVGGSDRIVDEDNDSIADILEVTLNMAVNQEGTYRWSARLEDRNGTEIGFASGSGLIPLTGGTLTLQFDGEPIANNNADGPYFVKDLFIFGAGATSIAEVHTTLAYNASQFGGSIASASIVSMQGNTNSNDFSNPGDVTSVTLEIEPSRSATRLVMAWGDGVVTEHAIDAGQTTVTLALNHVYSSGGMYVVTASLRNAAGTLLDSNDTLAFVRGVRLSNSTLQLVGSDKNDVIDVFPIDKTRFKAVISSPGLPTIQWIDLRSRLGNIVVFAGSGDDLAIVNEQFSIPSTLDGGSGHDVLKGGSGDDTLIGGEGNDVMYGFAGNDLLRGNSGRDHMYGGKGNDRLDGLEGDDYLYGERGNDALYGGDGVDYLFAQEGADLLSGGQGNDWLYGGSGNDSLAGDNGNDTLYGEDGDDIIDGGLDVDTLFGGSGVDQLLFGEKNYQQ